jgi:hypothetical protein
MEPEIVAPLKLETQPQGPRVPLESWEAAFSEPARLDPAAETLRAELTEEIVAMLRYATSGGSAGEVDPAAGEVIDRLAEDGTRLTTSELLEAHRALKLLVAPATPAGIRTYCEMRAGAGPLLGPHATIRRLSCANVLFMFLFFATSLTPLVNVETIHLSVYEQSGLPLFFKLLLITAVGGIGATFAVLFEAWEDVRQCRFDPVMESAYWLQIGLGVVAAITLTEIVQTGAPEQGEVTIKEPLIALAGGFSAGLLHVVLSRVVKTIRNFFAPSEAKT